MGIPSADVTELEALVARRAPKFARTNSGGLQEVIEDEETGQVLRPYAASGRRLDAANAEPACGSGGWLLCFMFGLMVLNGGSTRIQKHWSQAQLSALAGGCFDATTPQAARKAFGSLEKALEAGCAENARAHAHHLAHVQSRRVGRYIVTYAPHRRRSAHKHTATEQAPAPGAFDFNLASKDAVLFGLDSSFSPSTGAVGQEANSARFSSQSCATPHILISSAQPVARCQALLVPYVREVRPQQLTPSAIYIGLGMAEELGTCNPQALPAAEVAVGFLVCANPSL